jgi:serine/threonine protein kinase
MPRNERSISDEATYIGKTKSSDPISLGDHDTLGTESSRDPSSLCINFSNLAQRYVIESVIGQGGMGMVHVAIDTRLKRKVAIKRIKLKNHPASNTTLQRRFLTEAQSIAQLNNNNIVQVYDYGHDEHGPYLVLEYVDGGTLADKLKTRPMSLEDSVQIICQLCDGLRKAHEAGIIHRDIKPSNILLTSEGVPKLSDFGLARVEGFDSGQTIAGSVLGTLDFMSPEQRMDITLTDARSDLWSLAATFYQMVTGKRPNVIRLSAVPPETQAFFSKALEDEPSQRYQTANDFQMALIRSIQDDKKQTREKTTQLAKEELLKIKQVAKVKVRIWSSLMNALLILSLTTLFLIALSQIDLRSTSDPTISNEPKIAQPITRTSKETVKESKQTHNNQLDQKVNSENPMMTSPSKQNDPVFTKSTTIQSTKRISELPDPDRTIAKNQESNDVPKIIFSNPEPKPVNLEVKNFTGKWLYTWERQGMKVETTFDLKQEGDKVTGTVSGMADTKTEIQDGAVKDGLLTFKVVRERNGNKFSSDYAGKLEGDSLKGKISMEIQGQTREREFEAKRAD